MFENKKPKDVPTAAIDAIDATGQTALYDAIIQAMDSFKKAAKRAPLLIVITDGADTIAMRRGGAPGEEEKRRACIERIKKPGVPNFHIIFLAVKDADMALLQQIKASNGHTDIIHVENSGTAITEGLRKINRVVRDVQQRLVVCMSVQH